MGKISKKTIRGGVMVIILIIIVLIVLDFVPVKFAKKIDVLNIDESIIICQANFKTGISGYDWATTDYQSVVQFTENSKSPFDVLSKRDFEMFEVFRKTDMKFAFYGNLVDEKTVTDERTETSGRLKIFDATNWDVIYPIERKNSFRGAYAPKGYLTVYDYDWLKVIKSWFD